MKMSKNTSRRNFLKKSVLTTGIATVGSYGLANNSASRGEVENNLPRKVWIGAISQMGLMTETPQLMVEEINHLIEKVVIYKPDIICFPEVFPTSNVEQQLGLSEKLEVSKEVLKQFSALAKQHSCYMICPVFTSEDGKAYNSAVVFDREGVSLGEYRKIHLTEGEIEKGLTPGPLNPPVFQTDFGKIGIQICFDMLWDDGWTKLKDQGAEIVFWPSAYAGGVMVNTKARQHKYIVASSTRKNTAKISDFTGEVVAKTGIWDENFYCAPVNMERALLHTWPFVNSFDEIRKKYGRKVKITTFHEEEWSIIESLSPDILVSDILEEFNLKTFEQHTRDAGKAQNKSRKDLF